MRIILSGILLLFLVGCQTQANQTPAKPLDYVVNAEKVKTKEAIIATFLSNGYQISKDSEFQLALDRPAENDFAAQLLLGSDFNRVPNARVIMTFLSDNPTKVNARMQVVTNPGSGFEKPLDVSNNHKGREKIFGYMQQVKSLVEKEPNT